MPAGAVVCDIGDCLLFVAAATVIVGRLPTLGLASKRLIWLLLTHRTLLRLSVSWLALRVRHTVLVGSVVWCLTRLLLRLRLLLMLLHHVKRGGRIGLLVSHPPLQTS